MTLAVYFYFLASLFGAQWVMPATEEVNPVFALFPNLKGYIVFGLVLFVFVRVVCQISE